MKEKAKKGTWIRQGKGPQLTLFSSLFCFLVGALSNNLGYVGTVPFLRYGVAVV